MHQLSWYSKGESTLSPVVRRADDVFSLSIVIFYNVTVCACQLHDKEELWRRTQLTAVVSYSNIETLFKELYQRKFSVYRVPGLSEVRSEGVQRLDSAPDSLKLKKRICQSIFSSDYFSSTREKFVNPKAWGVSSKLRKKQTVVYKDMYKRTDKRPLVGGDPDNGFKYQYRNPFTERAVSIHGQAEKVFLFSCLVKRARLRGYKQYFISEEYDIGAPFSRSIAGRFVFGFDINNELVVHAVAQESAMSFRPKEKTDVEYFYLDKKLSRSVASKEADPVCGLSLGEKLRLCAAIFSMQRLTHKYKFVSSRESVQGECLKRPISYRNEDVKNQIGEQVLHEWMFPCNPSSRKGKKLILETFYVCRAYANDKVFLFRRRGSGKMVLKYYIYNTGIIDDAEIIDQHYRAVSGLDENQVRLEKVVQI